MILPLLNIEIDYRALESPFFQVIEATKTDFEVNFGLVFLNYSTLEKT
jgi:hypothetical protein